MAHLAIKGHPTRGNEVIEILEMLGGRNLHLQSGCGNGIYLINTCDNIIYFNQPKDIIYDFIILTLEEFLEKYPYKVGDKVTHSDYESPLEIVDMKWEYDSIKYEVYTNDYGYWFIVDELQPYKEETMEASEEFFNKYCKKCGSQRCTAEGEWLEECEYYKHYKEETMEEIRIDFPKGYDYVGIENKQVIFTKIKPQYPKTYDECCDVLGLNNAEIKIKVLIHNIEHGEAELYRKFIELKRCREAYWKIAGDWEEKRKGKVIHYVIYSTLLGEVVKDATPNSIANYLLDFPTEEMREAFYKNFKELIESCKELL